MVDPLVLALLFCAAAMLYGSVGHAGASAYLGIMGLLGVSPDVARPTALALNIAVASFITFRFWRGGYVRVRALAPLLLGSVPLAFLGGLLPVAAALYKQLVGFVLLVAAAGLAHTARRAAAAETGTSSSHVPPVPGVVIAAGIGFLAGLTGTGGGIFLSPVLLFARWAETKSASGLAAGFILANSSAGLAGNVARLESVPPAIPLWVTAVLLGAVVGSQIGIRVGRIHFLRTALSLVLLIAGLKLIFVD